ncbi:bcl-2-related protein A1-like [Saccoglossus kowalevskii]|uniref:Induced myeloid leukemia cell differentiation protein Mcl-1-like n=1 Tax=Saccoglossus kowalevskii TaxID=10224 RepID=A0ABM0GIR3_SACKO|nr:PREDICTED: induced myeloid leukemia cell differentiation protein Mcl-1-like [Saccoglossus kowalevskii]
MATAFPNSTQFRSSAQKGILQIFNSSFEKSLPHSPPNDEAGEETEIPSPDTDRTINLEDQAITNTAKQLAEDYIDYKTSKCAKKPSCTHAETLRRVGDEIDDKYNISLNGVIKRLEFSPENDGYSAYRACLDSMFDEGQINWGRIATVYVFSGRLAKHCQEQDTIEYVDSIKEYTTKYISSKLSNWIKKQGGWDAMNEAFKAKDWTEKIAFNGLVMTGAVLGGLAALRLVLGK